MIQESLRDMGLRYAEEADKLEQMIVACRERKRFAMRGGNSGEAQRQERLVELHTQQRNDLIRLSAWLRSYYGGEHHMEKGETHEKHQSHIA